MSFCVLQPRGPGSDTAALTAQPQAGQEPNAGSNNQWQGLSIAVLEDPGLQQTSSSLALVAQQLNLVRLVRDLALARGTAAAASAV